MHAYVRFRLPDGTTHVLGHGDLIGRLESAALHIDDARISEAHGLISLRGRELKLLALRGLFAVDGKPVSEIVLRKGLIVSPARDLGLVVEDVALPDAVMALEAPQLARQVLSGANSLFLVPRPSLVGRYKADAVAHIWSTGGEWRVKVGANPAQPLRIGDTFSVGDQTFSAVSVPLESASSPVTRLEGAIGQPLHIIANFDTVHVRLGDRQAVALDGISARILSELVAFEGPVDWHVLAGEIWEQDERALLRRRWDIALARLRRKLRAAGVRGDLVRAGGTGKVELYLYESDSVDDCT